MPNPVYTGRITPEMLREAHHCLMSMSHAKAQRLAAKALAVDVQLGERTLQRLRYGTDGELIIYKYNF